MATGPQRRPNDAYEEEKREKTRNSVWNELYLNRVIYRGVPRLPFVRTRAPARTILHALTGRERRRPEAHSRPRPDGSGSLRPALPPAALEPA